jgi:hypothetical protein
MSDIYKEVILLQKLMGNNNNVVVDYTPFYSFVIVCLMLFFTVYQNNNCNQNCRKIYYEKKPRYNQNNLNQIPYYNQKYLH